MLIISNSMLPFGSDYYAINLFGIIFVKHSRSLTAVQRNHEYIHTRQMRELLYVGFYILYVVEWLLRLAIYRNQSRAYSSISFEREAYGHQADLDYARHRPLFAQWRRATQR